MSDRQPSPYSAAIEATVASCDARIRELEAQLAGLREAARAVLRSEGAPAWARHAAQCRLVALMKEGG